MGWLGKPKILAYIGFGDDEIAYIRGRVVEDKELSKTTEKQSIWSNMVAMAKRYGSDEIPHAEVQAEFNGQILNTIANEYGEFEFTFHLLKPLPQDQTWHKVKLSLIEPYFPENEEFKTIGDVMIARPDSRYGIISDIDDTILISHSTSFLKKLRLMLLKNASNRLPFEGVAAFYRALHLGPDDNCLNPLFYVSSSEWNLYDLLIDFCRHKNIPKGAYLLHDLKVGLLKLFKSGRGKHNHKLIKINKVLTTFQNLQFILIGDSGQKDPEIYRTIIEEFPQRILAVYIRDVSSRKRHIEVKKIADKLKKDYGVEMLLVKDTEASALHAIDCGYILPKTLFDIARERYKDQYSSQNLMEVLKQKKIY